MGKVARKLVAAGGRVLDALGRKGAREVRGGRSGGLGGEIFRAKGQRARQQKARDGATPAPKIRAGRIT
jgi:hypothetical protein